MNWGLFFTELYTLETQAWDLRKWPAEREAVADCRSARGRIVCDEQHNENGERDEEIERTGLWVLPSRFAQ